jgi:HEAT repeat protein
MATPPTHAGETTVVWYQPYELERPDKKPPALGVKLIEYAPVAQLLDEGQELLPGGQLVFENESVAALLVSRQVTGNEEISLAVRLIDLKTGRVVWEKPWPFEKPEPLALVFGQIGISKGKGAVIAHAKEGRRTSFRLADGQEAAPTAVATQEGRRALGVIGTLGDGRDVTLTARKEGSEEQREGESQVQVLERMDLGIQVAAVPGVGGKPHDMPVRQLAGSKPQGPLVPQFVSSEGIIVCVEMREKDPYVLHGYDLETQKARWAMPLEAGVLGINETTDGRVIVQLGEVIGATQPVFAAFPDYLGILAIEMASAKTCYKIDAKGGSERWKAPDKPHYLCSVRGVDIHEGENEKGNKVIFAVASKDGTPRWRSDQSGGELADFNPSTGEVSLMGFSTGIRFDAETGRQIAVLQIESHHQRSQLARAGDVWVLDGKLLTAKESTPITIVRIDGPGVDEDPAEALARLIQALTDERVEYRRGAAESLSNLSMPCEVGPAMAPLAKALTDADVMVRLYAAEAIRWLAEYDKNAKVAAGALEKALDDSDPRVRTQAALALGIVDQNSEVAGKALIKLLDVADEKTRFLTRIVLAGMAPKFAGEVVKLMRRDLASDDAKVREKAAGLVASAGNTHGRIENMAAIIPALTHHLTEDTSADVRMRCANSLEKFGPAAKSALPALRKAIKDEADAVNRFALLSLAAVGPEAGDVSLLSQGLSKKDSNVKGTCAKALSKMGPPGVQALLAKLDDLDQETLYHVVCGLGQSGEHGRPAVEPLLALLERETAAGFTGPDQSRLAGYVMYALGSLGDVAAEKVVPVLMKHARGTGELSWTAILAMGEMGEAGAPAVPLMMKFLNPENSPYLHMKCAKALGRVGPKAAVAVPRLRELLKSRLSPVRAAAAEALKRIEAAPGEKQ